MIYPEITLELRTRFHQRSTVEPFIFTALCAAYQRGVRLWPREGLADDEAWQSYLWHEVANHDISPEDALDIFEFMFPSWYFEIENLWQEQFGQGDQHELDLILNRVLHREGKTTEDFRAINALRLAVRLWSCDILPENPTHRRL